jgi:hypothetical protein
VAIASATPRSRVVRSGERALSDVFDPQDPQFAFIIEYMKWKRQIEPELPELLFHYSPVSSMIEIISNSALWASDARHMNDSSELIHGEKIISQIIEALLRAEIDPRLNGLLGFFGEMQENRETWIRNTIYISCFCARRNLLSMWRSYGHSRPAVAMGIDPRHVLRLPDVFRLERVLYRKEDKRVRIESLYTLWRAQLLSDVASIVGDPSDFIVDRFIKLIGYASGEAVYFKHPHFREEREWRLVHILPPPGMPTPAEHRLLDVHFRSSVLGPIPYVVVELLSDDEPSHPFRTLTVGPCDHQSAVIEGLDPLLRRLNRDAEVTVTRSKTPYRATSTT